MSRPRPYRPFVRYDVFPPRGFYLFGKLTPTRAVYPDFHYTALEESA